MPLDPSLHIVTNADPNRSGELADLKRRVTALEQGGPKIQVMTSTSPPPRSLTNPVPGGGAPTGVPRDGAVAFDVPTSKGYVRMNGAWYSWPVTSP